MDSSKEFIWWSIFYQQEYKVQNSCANSCNYSDMYIFVKVRIVVKVTNNVNKGIKKLTFKNNALFRSCISKINNTIIDNADDLDILLCWCIIY